MEWLGLLVQPAVILGGGALFLNQLNKRIDDQNKRIDDLREDVKELRAEHRADNKALNEKVDDLRGEVKGLPLKIMEMLRKAPH